MTFPRKLGHLGLSFRGLSKWEKDRRAAILSGGIPELVRRSGLISTFALVLPDAKKSHHFSETGVSYAGI